MVTLLLFVTNSYFYTYAKSQEHRAPTRPGEPGKQKLATICFWASVSDDSLS